MSASKTGGPGTGGELRVPLDGFAWEALEHESASQGVPPEEVARFAILYYLADVDSGRVARRITGSPLGPGNPAAGSGSTA